MDDRSSRRATVLLALMNAAAAIILTALVVREWSRPATLSHLSPVARGIDAPRTDGDGNGPSGTAPSGTESPATCRELEDLRTAFREARLKLEAVSPIVATGANVEVSKHDLRSIVSQVLTEMRNEALSARYGAQADSMERAALQNVTLLAQTLNLTGEQQDKLSKVLKDEAAECRKLLLQAARGPEYQDQAGTIITRTEERVRAILTVDQVPKYTKAGIDWWGSGLDYERKR